MNGKLMVGAIAAAALVQGCSSRPREFNPTLATPAADAAKFKADYAECHQLMVAGKLDRNGVAGSAGAGAAAGAATLAGGAAAATSAGLYGGMAVASATIVAIPFVAIGGAFAMAKIKRNKKEKAIQQVMAGCLDQRGHEIVGWKNSGKKMKVDPMGKKKAKPAAKVEAAAK